MKSRVQNVFAELANTCEESEDLTGDVGDEQGGGADGRWFLARWHRLRGGIVPELC